jgi:hypothetical protein
VPVYRGAPNIDEFAPGDHCFIDANRFASVRDLASYLTYLAGDETAYSRYFDWRSRPLRESFITQLQEAEVAPFCRLAAIVAQMLDRGETERARCPPTRPFGWCAYARTRLGRLRRRLLPATRR